MRVYPPANVICCRFDGEPGAAATPLSGALKRSVPLPGSDLAPFARTGPKVLAGVNGWPFSDCHPAPGLGRLLSATIVVPLSSHSPIAPLVFWNKRSACPFGVK